jgi:hypothetical protein
MMIETMEFHEFPTVYSVLKRNGLTDESPDRFYAGALALLRAKASRFPSHALAVEHNRTVCEWDWMRGGSPYFKVYPAMIPLLSGVGIEVPVDYLRLPFQAFAVRLPAEGNPQPNCPPHDRAGHATEERISEWAASGTGVDVRRRASVFPLTSTHLHKD